MQESLPAGVVTLAYLAAALLILIHLFSGKLRFLDVTPRSIWLSIAGGVSVAYVFVHLLPELSDAQETLRRALPEVAFLEHHVYLVALAGLLAFYGLEKLAVNARTDQARAGGEDRLPGGVFWLHLGSFAVYNGLVGYLLLHREKPGLVSLAWFAFAMALHFLVADFGLREHYKESYHRIGRYVLAGAVAFGLILGQATSVPKPFVSVLFGFLAGGVMLNVLKEEMPKERKSRFWAFATGALLYTIVLLLT